MEKQVVEYAGIPVGITIPDGNGVKFIAVKFPVIELDGEIYENLADLQVAIRNHLEMADRNGQAIFSAAIAPSVTGPSLGVPDRKAFNAA